MEEWTTISSSQVKSKDAPSDEEKRVGFSDLIFRNNDLIVLMLNLEVNFSLEK